MEPDRSEEYKFVAAVRYNTVFEQAVISVLIGAGLGGAAIFAVSVAGAVMDGMLSLMQLVSITISSVFVSFLIFLVGFLSSIVVIAPLSTALEKTKLRSVWPYLAAALAIALIALTFLNGGLPIISDIDIDVIVSVIAPAIVIALIFGRRMQPYWRAAARADLGEVKIVRRLH